MHWRNWHPNGYCSPGRCTNPGKFRGKRCVKYFCLGKIVNYFCFDQGILTRGEGLRHCKVWMALEGHRFTPHQIPAHKVTSRAQLYAAYCFLSKELVLFQIHGLVRVVMKPLITTMPLVGGLQIFFLNNPAIDFNLVGVADLLDMPGLRFVYKLPLLHFLFYLIKLEL